MHSKFCLFCAALVAVVIFPIPRALALDPAPKCEARKLKEAGKYAFCRLKAEAKGVKRGLPADYSTCVAKFALKWPIIESNGEGECPSNGDVSEAAHSADAYTRQMASCLAGGKCPAFGRMAATGQTTSYGPGSDGDVQAGEPLSYTDNGDGTITDNNNDAGLTGLMWEKKDDSGGIHDKDDVYTWSTGTNDMDGTVVTTFLDTLNDVGGGGVSCFAGYCDWRIPNRKELESILDFGLTSPSLDPVFFQSATCTGCTDVTLPTCSCTGAQVWSSTTANNPINAILVRFNDAFVDSANKTSGTKAVRAVRGGL